MRLILKILLAPVMLVLAFLMVFGNPGSCKWFDVSLLYQADALGRKQ